MDKTEYDRWLKKNGVHPDQIKARKGKSEKKLMISTINVVEEYYGNLSNSISPPAYSNTIWDKIKDGEKPETILEIKRKASKCLAPYNKGSLQFISDDMLIFAGKKL